MVSIRSWTVQKSFRLLPPALGCWGVASWARVANAACAARLTATADVLDAHMSADGSAEHEDWCLDNWEAAAAEVAAAQNVSPGVASHQLLVARALRERLPRVAEVFASGAISYRVVNAIVARTRLIQDREAMARWTPSWPPRWWAGAGLSVAKTETAIDYWVDRYDPYALRRSEMRSRDRHLDVVPADDGTGLAWPDRRQALRARRRRAGTAGRCAGTRGVPRSTHPRAAPRRCDGRPGGRGRSAGLQLRRAELPRREHTPPSAAVVHVIAEEPSLADDTPVQLDGTAPTPGPGEAAAGDDAGRGAGPAPAATHWSGPHRSGRRAGWRDPAGTAVGGQARRHLHDPPADPPRRCTTAAALHPVAEQAQPSRFISRSRTWTDGIPSLRTHRIGHRDLDRHRHSVRRARRASQG